MNQPRRRNVAQREKFRKTSDKLVKAIRFEVEVQKNIAQTIAELHRKRLKEIQKHI